MAKISPLTYLRQVRTEMNKVSWPSRRETTVSTLTVFVMALLASLFLFFADQILSFLVGLILQAGM